MTAASTTDTMEIESKEPERVAPRDNSELRNLVLWFSISIPFISPQNKQHSRAGRPASWSESPVVVSVFISWKARCFRIYGVPDWRRT